MANTEQKIFESLKGKYKHYCVEWDGMAIDETLPEFEACLCYNDVLKGDKMTEKYDDLLYLSGLTAQGCWDELDQYAKNAIMRFANLIVTETINEMGQQMSDLGDDQSNNPTWYKAQIKTLEHFGMKL